MAHFHRESIEALLRSSAFYVGEFYKQSRLACD